MDPGPSSAENSIADLSDGGLRAGQLLDQFRILRELGRGGMGIVYAAEDTLLRRRVAIKVIPHAMDGSGDLLREARAVGQLDHPNVLRVYHIGQWSGGYYLVLELVTGGSLQDRLAQGPLPWPVATQMLTEACRGLAAAHAAGLIHHDIKPGNLMCGNTGIKVADFGLVRGVDLTRSAQGLLAGTPLYMSPEQCRGEKADQRSDIYAIGATYYHLITGQPPYAATTPVQVMFAHCAKPVPDVRTVIPDLPLGCVAIVQKAMSKDAADRFQSVAEMREALEGSLSPAATLPLLSSITHASLTAASRPTLFRRSWVAAGAVLLLMSAVIAVMIMGRGRPAHVFNVSKNGKQPADFRLGSFGPALVDGRQTLELGGMVTTIAFSADGKFLAAGTSGSDGGAILWDLERDKLARRLNWGAVYDLAFSQRPEKTCLLGASARGPRIWFGDSDQDRFAVDGWSADWGSVNAVAFKDSAAWAMARGGEIDVYRHGKDRLWQRSDEKDAKWPVILQLLLAPDPSIHRLVAVDTESLIHVWDSETGAALRPVPFGSKKAPPVLAFAPKGQVLAIAILDLVEFWQLQKHEHERPRVRVPFDAAHGKGPPIRSLAFSADGKYLAAGDASGGVTVWSYPDCLLLHSLSSEGQPISDISLHPDGQLLAAGDAGGKVHLWDLRKATKVANSTGSPLLPSAGGTKDDTE